LKINSTKKYFYFFQDGSESKSKHIPKTSSAGNADSSSHTANQFLKAGSNPSSPPESVFVRLAPNHGRYSFRDEL